MNSDLSEIYCKPAGEITLSERMNLFRLGLLNVNINDDSDLTEWKQKVLMELSADIISGRADEFFKVQGDILPKLRKFSRQRNDKSNLFF